MLIRNFSIIAHVDHGKSTLADRFLELTHTFERARMQDQVLDSMDLERERGITIKAHPVRMDYRARDGRDYVLNLIDTPGHVDFSYEVSRALAAGEGAILLVDAAQGIEAQTISNLYLALDLNLAVIPVINKIDLPNAQTEVVRHQLTELLGVDAGSILLASAKTGRGVAEVLEAVIARVPAPPARTGDPAQALIFDSVFSSYHGVIPYLRVFAGELIPGNRIFLHSTGKAFEIEEVGVFKPSRQKTARLGAGEVGYLIAGIKDLADARVGDTVTADPAIAALPGYREVKPYVYCGFYPTTSEGFGALRSALEKLRLNDAALSFEPETSQALGFGFRCGFLGLLHMEIIQERLEREFGQGLVATLPSVKYRVTLTDGSQLEVDNPARFPESGRIATVEEPWVRLEILMPTQFVGDLMQLCLERRGIQTRIEYLDAAKVHLEYELPLAEMIFDFYDKLKTLTRGYGTLDYEVLDYRVAELARVDILVNGEPVDALSTLIHRTKAYRYARGIIEKLRTKIPRQLFEVVIQASIGKRIIARTSIAALRKDVTAKCYGGDITRKRKLLERQREGKKRMKRVGHVEIPQEAFLAVLKVD